MFKKVMVAYDLSEQSRRALGIGGGLARMFGASLVVVYVLPMSPELRRLRPTPAATDSRRYKEMVRRLSGAAQIEVERTVRRKGVVAVGEARCVVRVGEAAVELVDVAEREGAT